MPNTRLKICNIFWRSATSSIARLNELGVKQRAKLFLVVLSNRLSRRVKFALKRSDRLRACARAATASGRLPELFDRRERSE